MIRKYRNQRIATLPQTIYFESVTEYEKCFQIFSKHPDLQICVRDRKSFKLAEKMTENAYLMPDIAYQLYPLEHKDSANKGNLFFCRTDKESVNVDEGNISYEIKIDWDELLEKDAKQISFFRVVRYLRKFKLHYFTSALTSYIWMRLSKKYVGKAISLFSRRPYIYTNRLHGHILSCLMDIPNILLDNSYGKNSSYKTLWITEKE